jgi:hypothetical protein
LDNQLGGDNLQASLYFAAEATLNAIEKVSVDSDDTAV